MRCEPPVSATMPSAPLTGLRSKRSREPTKAKNPAVAAKPTRKPGTSTALSTIRARAPCSGPCRSGRARHPHPTTSGGLIAPGPDMHRVREVILPKLTAECGEERAATLRPRLTDSLTARLGFRFAQDPAHADLRHDRSHHRGGRGDEHDAAVALPAEVELAEQGLDLAARRSGAPAPRQHAAERQEE